MDTSIEKELITIVAEDSTKAIGCTEPVAVAYATNIASEYLNKDEITTIDLRVSKNIYKNGKAVKIPNTKDHGLDFAGSLGSFTSKSEMPFLVFSNLTEEEIKKSRAFADSGKVNVNYIDDVPNIYIEATLTSPDD